MVKHDFAVNLNESDPEIEKISGIDQAYVELIKSNVMQLSGPTLFAPILRKAVNKAQQFQKEMAKKQQYLVLLIITDGIINVIKHILFVFVYVAWVKTRKLIF